MSRNRVMTWALVAGALAMALSVGACRREPRGRCGRLIAELQSPAKAKESIRLLGEKQGGKSCAKAVPQLAKMFTEGRYRADILRSVKHMGKDEVVQFPEYRALLSEALNLAETDSIAASVIEDWKLSEMKEDLIKLLSDKKSNPKSRGAALDALLSFAKPAEIEDVLVALAIADPDKQGMKVNVAAVEKLAELRSVKGLPNVIKTLFIKTQRGEEMYQAARMGLIDIGGTTARDLLVETLGGKNEDLRAYTRSAGIPDWEWMDGPKVVQVIGDLSDPSASKAVAENMAKKLVEPAGITEKAIESWKISNSNRLTINMLTLSRIGDDTVVPVLAPVIADSMNDFMQRMHSASALANIGSQAAIDALFKVYEESGDQRFRAPFLRPLTLALDTAHLAKFDELLKKEEKNKAELVLEKLQADPMIVGAIAVVRECVNEDSACLIKNLSAEPVAGEDGKVTDMAKAVAQAKQLKAIVMLGRKVSDADAIIPELLKKFESSKATETDLRNYSLIALERIGRNNKKVYDGLKKIVEAERKKAGHQFWTMELDARVKGFAARQAGEPGTAAAAPAEKPADKAAAPAEKPAADKTEKPAEKKAE